MKKNLIVNKYMENVFGYEFKIEQKVKSLREIKNEIKMSINDKLSFTNALDVWDGDTGEVYFRISKNAGVDYIASGFYKEASKLLKICK